MSTVAHNTSNRSAGVADRRKYISASVADQLAEEVGRNGDRPPHERLSDREREVLSLTASGRGAKEIAAALSISKSTVST
jgi:two-component system, NarL family, invasion response regulator UvrY